MSERRGKRRRPVDVFFNKYLGGHPHLCRAVDVSETGMHVVVLSEPDGAMESFPMELRLPGDSTTLWLWGRCVRRTDRKQAIEFIGLTDDTKMRIKSFVLRAA